ncbi:MAG: hypothetical protein EHM39_14355 [Chloroflexi bacterium]|nr:MAG: hypothetical protein EHM39_14355 [Chloroflexota bacterium]
MPPTKLTSTKRFAVSVSLVTGSTLAVMIGAQSLASLDDKLASISDSEAPGQVIQVAGSAPAAAAPSRPTTRSSR